MSTFRWWRIYTRTRTSLQGKRCQELSIGAVPPSRRLSRFCTARQHVVYCIRSQRERVDFVLSSGVLYYCALRGALIMATNRPSEQIKVTPAPAVVVVQQYSSGSAPVAMNSDFPIQTTCPACQVSTPSFIYSLILQN